MFIESPQLSECSLQCTLLKNRGIYCLLLENNLYWIRFFSSSSTSQCNINILNSQMTMYQSLFEFLKRKYITHMYQSFSFLAFYYESKFSSDDHMYNIEEYYEICISSQNGQISSFSYMKCSIQLTYFY